MLKHFIKIVITKVNFTTLIKFKGSTLVIMRSIEEPHCLFGGMAAPSWDSSNKFVSDPAD